MDPQIAAKIRQMDNIASNLTECMNKVDAVETAFSELGEEVRLSMESTNTMLETNTRAMQAKYESGAIGVPFAGSNQSTGRSLLEAKSILNLSVLGTNGVAYSDWRERFENALIPLRPSYGMALKLALQNKSVQATKK